MVIRQIMTQVKSDLSSGRLARGGKLPVRDDLVKYYGVSKSTVQKVFAALEKEGYIVSRGSRGTFVNPKSPDRTDVAVILPAGSRESTGNTFYAQFERERSTLDHLTGKHFRLFYVDDMRFREDDFMNLAQDVRDMKFYGAIFAFAPRQWMFEPFLKYDIPVASLTDEEFPQISTVWVDYSDLLYKMLEECRNSGCRRPALLSHTTVPFHHIDDCMKRAAELGIGIPAHQICGLTPESSCGEWLKHSIRALFSHETAPDALLLLDEKFLLPSYSALLELGKIPGKDIRLISQRTFPGSMLAPEPVTFIGFDLHEIVRSCLRALDSLAAGNPPANKFELLKAVQTISKKKG